MANGLSGDGTAYKSSNFGTYCLLFSAMLYHPQLDDSLANHPKLDTLTNHPFLEFDLTSLSLHASMYRKSTTSRA